MQIKHRRRGTTYMTIARATFQTSNPEHKELDQTKCLVYVGNDGEWHVRLQKEFTTDKWEF